MALTITRQPVDALSEAARRQIIALCTDAFDEDFQRLFELLPGSTHLLAAEADDLVGHACWVTRWLHHAPLPPLRTAYVEAVVVAPGRQGQGIGSQLIRRVIDEVTDFPLAALSPATPAFYARLGWETWRGALAIRTATGPQATPDDEVMIYRLPTTPTLDLDGLLTAEWRPGELW